jgi:type I restriction enzyme S subunit
VSELPEGWEWKPLSKLCVEKDGIVDGPFGSNLKRSDYKSSGIPVLKIQNVKTCSIVWKKMDYVSQEKFDELRRHSYVEGDIVMTKLGEPLGISALVEGVPDGLIVADLVRLRPTGVNPKFLEYQLNSPQVLDSINAQQKGTTRPRVNLKMVRELPIAVPPLDVQQRIVETLEDHLSRLDKALTEVEVARRQSESLARAMRRNVFAPESMPDGWVSTRLSDVLSPIAGKRLTQRGWSPQCLNHPRSSDEGWGVLKTTAIQLGDFQPHHHKELPASLDAKPEIEVVPGDLIMTATGPRNRCGIPCLVQETPSRLMMSGKMFRFRTNPSVCDSRWLLQFLLSDVGQRQLESLKVGSSDSSVSIGSQQFENIEMPLPPLSVQLSFLSELDQQVDRAKHFGLAIESTGAQAETLRRSLLHAAFTGQLRNEAPND